MWENVVWMRSGMLRRSTCLWYTYPEMYLQMNLSSIPRREVIYDVSMVTGYKSAYFIDSLLFMMIVMGLWVMLCLLSYIESMDCEVFTRIVGWWSRLTSKRCECGLYVGQTLNPASQWPHGSSDQRNVELCKQYHARNAIKRFWLKIQSFRGPDNKCASSNDNTFKCTLLLEAGQHMCI